MQHKRIVKLAAATVAALGIVAGGTLFAYASIPSSSTGRFTGCYSASTPLRLIDADAGQTCNAGETKVSWGGGMRFRGVWTYTGGANPGNIPYTSSDPVQKGDVIRFEGPSNLFGCTTPRGSWVNVAGSHAYPCLEFPHNWAPLALDGPQGSNADVHWVKLNGAGQVTASSDSRVTSYPAGSSYSYAYIQVPFDVTRCAVTATAAYPARVLVTVQVYSGNWVLVAGSHPTTGSMYGNGAVAFDVTMACGRYS